MKRFLLVCGIMSTLLYIATDLILSSMYPGYRLADQAISELSAIGAPTRGLWIAMSFVFNPLLVAFGLGVWSVAVQNRSLRITGLLLVLWGALGFVWLLFPMHVRGAIGSTTDTMHLVMAAVTVLLILLFMGFGSNARGPRFRIYSILSLAAMLVFGTLVAMQAPQVAANQPTPFMGIMERVTVYSPMIWVLVLAVILLRRGTQISHG